MWSLRSRRKRGDFHTVRRDAVLLVGGLGVLSVLSVLIGHALPRIDGSAKHTTTQAAGTVPSEGAVAAPANSPQSAAPTVPSAPRVAHPWTPGRPQLGIDVYWAANPKESTQITQTKINATVTEVVNLNANWISITFPFVTRGASSNQLSADSSMTPSLARLEMLVTAATSAGLHVSLRPLLDEASLVAQDAKSWRGLINPTDKSAWFASYTAFLTPYVQLAQKNHVDAFNISTELSSMEGDTAAWTALTAHLAPLYSGQLVYSINYDRVPANTVRIPNAKIGVDTYFPIKDAHDDASVAQLVDGWNKALNAYSSGPLSDLTFSEVGIVSQDGAYQAPYVWKSSGAVDSRIQVSWDTAACQVAQTRQVAGIYWWYLDLENATLPPGAHKAADPLDILNTPGLDVIKNCFANFTSTLASAGSSSAASGTP